MEEFEPDARHHDFAADLRGVFRVLRRRGGIIALCVLLTAASALAYALSQPNEYSATATLLFRDPQLDQKLFGSSFFSPSVDPAREAATNLTLASLGTVAGLTAEKMGHGMTRRRVSSEIRVNTEGQANVASIKATDRNPQLAADLANAYAASYIEFRVQADRSKIQQAQQLVEDQYAKLAPELRASAQGGDLQNRAEQLKIFAALQTGNAEVAQTATVPTSPSAPKPRRDAVLGLLVGLVLGLGLAFLFDRLDQRIRDIAELEDVLQLPVLAAIPQSATLAGAPTSGKRLPGPVLEAFFMLRARLRYFNVDRNIRTVLVTSAAPGEGKTTVAIHLAVVAANASTRVLLLEVDLRRPTIGAKLGLGPGPGLSELLTHHAIGLKDVIRRVAQAPSAESNGSATSGGAFDVITAGALPPNSLELVESRKMSELLDQLSGMYDLIIIDTPPTSVVSDVIPLVGRVDGLIIVTRIGQSTRGAVSQLHSQLTKLRAPMLGCVANALTTGADGYAYAYGYGYGYGYPSATEESSASPESRPETETVI